MTRSRREFIKIGSAAATVLGARRTRGCHGRRSGARPDFSAAQLPDPA